MSSASSLRPDSIDSNIDSRPREVMVWVLAIRPATLSAAISPVAVGTALAAADGLLRPLVALAALLGALLIQIGTNLFNDYADFEKGADTAERLGPARATQRGWLTPSQVLRGAFVSLSGAFLIGIYLVVVGGWPIVAIGLASLACAILYTGGPVCGMLMTSTLSPKIPPPTSSSFLP